MDLVGKKVLLYPGIGSDVINPIYLARKGGIWDYDVIIGVDVDTAFNPTDLLNYSTIIHDFRTAKVVLTYQSPQKDSPWIFKFQLYEKEVTFIIQHSTLIEDFKIPTDKYDIFVCGFWPPISIVTAAEKIIVTCGSSIPLDYPDNYYCCHCPQPILDEDSESCEVIELDYQCRCKNNEFLESIYPNLYRDMEEKFNKHLEKLKIEDPFSYNILVTREPGKNVSTKNSIL